jgi:hypothetical protein
MKNQNQNPEVVVIDRSLNQCNFIKGNGEYRAIVKSRAGYMITVQDLGILNNWGKKQWNAAVDVFRSYKKGALQSIEFKPEGSDSWLTVFGRTGKKIKLIDQALLADLTVGDINQVWSNTNLYNQNQYQAVRATSWASKAYVMNP